MLKSTIVIYATLLSKRFILTKPISNHLSDAVCFHANEILVVNGLLF